MCVAMPARILEIDGEEGWVELGTSRLRTSLVLVPEAGVGDFVLVHAGFAIQVVPEADALEIRDLLGEAEG